MGNEPASILIVEDDPAILEILIEGLTDEGYRALGVMSLPDALAALHTRRYDLVLSDAFRPATADAVGEQWRPLEALLAASGDTPILIVTAHRLEDYADYSAHGFAAILGKPFDLDQLYETVRKVIG